MLSGKSCESEQIFSIFLPVEVLDVHIFDSNFFWKLMHKSQVMNKFS